MVRYYDEANDSFGALTSCPEWLMTIKDNKLKKLCELPDGLNISSFLLTDRGIICVSCAGAAVYRLSENGKYEETITYIDGLEDEEIPQISINEKEEYFIVMPNARKIFKCFMVIVETVILAVWACEILTWIIVSRIKKENIADMVRTTRDI